MKMEKVSDLSWLDSLLDSMLVNNLAVLLAYQLVVLWERKKDLMSDQLGLDFWLVYR